MRYSVWQLFHFLDYCVFPSPRECHIIEIFRIGPEKNILDEFKKTQFAVAVFFCQIMSFRDGAKKGCIYIIKGNFSFLYATFTVIIPTKTFITMETSCQMNVVPMIRWVLI